MGPPQPVPAPATGLPPGVEPGDIGKRILAYLIEWVIPGFVLGIVNAILGLLQLGAVSLIITLVLFLALIGWVVFVWWNYVTRAAGPGMKMMGLQLVGFSDGRPLSWGRVILRWLVLGVIAGTGIGAILLLVFAMQNPRGQSWADQIADSVVIKARALAPQQQAPAQPLAANHPQQAPPPVPAGAGDPGLFPQQNEHGVQTPVRYGQAERYGRPNGGYEPQGQYDQGQYDQGQYPAQPGADQYQAQEQYPPQSQYAQDQYPADQYGQDDHARGQYAQEQYGQGQYPQDQYQQDQYGQDQYAQDQYGQGQYRQDQYGQDQYGQDQYAQDQYQQDQYGQDQFGQGQEQYGQESFEQGGPAVAPVAAPIPGATQFPAAAPPPVSGSSASSAEVYEPDPRPLDQGWRVTLDDGRELDVTGLILLGRNPQARPGEDGAQLIKISDESRTVSKTHLAIGVDAGGIYVMDRGSTNGSTATDPGGQSRPCAAGDVVQVEDGTIVSFGDHWLEVKRP